ncbi:MAG: hypothetical protein EA349_14090 [Halomonadaceae bacterium]|nr:MAG: hypothetical protein EA349_14090 [Halomonadaceae bacterium]
MMTQSLRGMRGKGPMHWRGDRTGQNRQRGETLEEAAFKEFNEAFVGLLGREQELPREEMDKFTDFALQLSYPPNPIRKLDNSLTPVQAEGEEIYHTINTDLIATCNGCHKLSPEEGFFGTDGTMSIEGPGVAEDFKIPHLRNMYQKIGMFADNTQVDSPYLGNQIRGFGFDHQGSSGSVSNFLDALVFNLLLGPERRVIVEQFVLAFPSELNPIVGQQLTISPANHGRSDVQARLLLLEQRAAIKAPRPECDLIANAVSGDQIHSWVMNDNARFVPANPQAPALSTLELLSQFLAANEPVTFTCTPPGSGVRIAFRRGA